MKRALKLMAATGYVLLLGYLVFFARRRESMQDVRRRELVNLVPVVNQLTTYRGLAPKDRKGKQNFMLNLVGNVLLFIPFPLLVFSFGLRGRKKILVAALLTTAGIEAIQLVFHIGVPDVDDILLNMTGAFIGLLLLEQVPSSVRAALVRI